MAESYQLNTAWLGELADARPRSDTYAGPHTRPIGRPRRSRELTLASPSPRMQPTRCMRFFCFLCLSPSNITDFSSERPFFRVFITILG